MLNKTHGGRSGTVSLFISQGYAPDGKELMISLAKTKFDHRSFCTLARCTVSLLFSAHCKTLTETGSFDSEAAHPLGHRAQDMGSSLTTQPRLPERPNLFLLGQKNKPFLQTVFRRN